MWGLKAFKFGERWHVDATDAVMLCDCWFAFPAEPNDQDLRLHCWPVRLEEQMVTIKEGMEPWQKTQQTTIIRTSSISFQLNSSNSPVSGESHTGNKLGRCCDHSFQTVMLPIRSTVLALGSLLPFSRSYCCHSLYIGCGSDRTRSVEMFFGS